jgi:vacuolar-type H+-ATPase subunit I/STV1
VAVEKVSKVLVAVHQDNRDSFLKRLQRLGVLHVTGTEQAAADSRQSSAESRRVIEAIELLAPLAKK